MAVSDNFDQYAAYREKQLELAGMLKGASEVISDLNMVQFQENLKKLGDKVQNDSFKIQVVGTFKNGKSTFINSFLGEDILPAYALPATAVINEVKWGEKKRAVIHFRDPLPERLPAELALRPRPTWISTLRGPSRPWRSPMTRSRTTWSSPSGRTPQRCCWKAPMRRWSCSGPCPC